MSTVTGVTFSGSSGKAACLDVTATVDNVSGKQLNNADVFGRVYDAAGEAALDDVRAALQQPRLRHGLLTLLALLAWHRPREGGGVSLKQLTDT